MQLESLILCSQSCARVLLKLIFEIHCKAQCHKVLVMFPYSKSTNV